MDWGHCLFIGQVPVLSSFHYNINNDNDDDKKQICWEMYSCGNPLHLTDTALSTDTEIHDVTGTGKSPFVRVGQKGNYSILSTRTTIELYHLPMSEEREL